MSPFTSPGSDDGSDDFGIGGQATNPKARRDPDGKLFRESYFSTPQFFGGSVIITATLFVLCLIGLVKGQNYWNVLPLGSFGTALAALWLMRTAATHSQFRRAGWMFVAGLVGGFALIALAVALH